MRRCRGDQYVDGISSVDLKPAHCRLHKACLRILENQHTGRQKWCTVFFVRRRYRENPCKINITCNDRFLHWGVFGKARLPRSCNCIQQTGNPFFSRNTEHIANQLPISVKTASNRYAASFYICKKNRLFIPEMAENCAQFIFRVYRCFTPPYSTKRFQLRNCAPQHLVLRCLHTTTSPRSICDIHCEKFLIDRVFFLP